MSFEWRTDEEQGWTEEDKPKTTAVSQPFLRRRWRFLLVLLVSVTAVWLAVQWQINQRVELATVEVESELLATHNFLLQTAVDRDEDLFRANLSGRDPGWEEVQKTLLSEGLLLDRPMLGWQHEPTQERLTPEDVTFNLTPDLRGAELLYPQNYAITLPDGVTETVTLQQTAVYREGNTRWLYAPPFDDFWGEWVTDEGELVTLIYTERDAPVADRLATDLDALVVQMCAELADLNCGVGLRIHVRLDTNPDVWLWLNDVENVLKAGPRLNLPTPTLVGMPTDDAGYDVLYRAYAVELATAVLAYQTDYDCCRHQLFFRAVRDYQLAQLGLQAWPLEPAMYSQILANGFDGDVLSHWTRRWQEAPPQFLQVWMIEDPDPIWQQVYMLVEYVAGQETAVSPTQMMRLLNRNSYQGWLADVLLAEYDAPLFSTQFLEYIYAQSQDGQLASPPIPFPNEQIIAVCTDTEINASRNRVYAYDLASRSWAERLTAIDMTLGGYVSTVDGVHYIVSENEFEGSLATYQFYLVEGEEPVLLEETTVNSSQEHFIYYDLLKFGDEMKVLRYEYDQGDFSYILRSVACPTAGCPETEFSGILTFSPDGAYVIEHIPVDEIQMATLDLTEASFEATLYSADKEFRRPLGTHRIIRWLNDQQYGFVQEDGNGWQLFTATFPNSEFTPLFNKVDIQAAVNDDVELAQPNFILLPGSDDLLLYAQGITNRETIAYLIRVQLTEDLSAVEQVELLWEGAFSSIASVSPDGRYLMLADYNFLSSSSEITYQLLDLETMEHSSVMSNLGLGRGPSWSADGNWYIQSNENYFLLSAPAYDYQYYIPNGLGNCQQIFLSPTE